MLAVLSAAQALQGATFAEYAAVLHGCELNKARIRTLAWISRGR